MSGISVVIAEDEELAREKLVRWVENEQSFELEGVASDGSSALDLIRQKVPDLVFLDIRMPGLSGIEVLEGLDDPPFVVFTTAYDSYAVAAFELEAIDYLVKPFGPARFRKALERIERRVTASRTGPTARVPMLNVVEKGAVRNIPIADVWRFEGSGDYVAAWVEKKRYLLSTTLMKLDERLDSRFVRIHRSHLINVNLVEQFVRLGNGRWSARFPDGSSAESSRLGGRLIREYLDNR